MTTKRHHYVSQFLLAGFTDEYSKLNVVDLYKREVRKGAPNTVAHVKYFNKVEGLDNPLYLEEELSRLESEVAPLIRNIRNSGQLPESDDLSKLLEFVALLIRGPHQRTKMIDYYDQIASLVEGLTLDTFETYCRTFEEQGFPSPTQEEYEDHLAAHAKGEFTPFQIHQDTLILQEMQLVQTVHSCLLQRQWEILLAPTGSEFVCTDVPVTLFNPALPASGFINSSIIFPLWQGAVLHAPHEGLLPFPQRLRRYDVALINSIFAGSAYNYIWSSDGTFPFLFQGKVHSGAHEFLKLWFDMKSPTSKGLNRYTRRREAAQNRKKRR